MLRRGALYGYATDPGVYSLNAVPLNIFQHVTVACCTPAIRALVPAHVLYQPNQTTLSNAAFRGSRQWGP